MTFTGEAFALLAAVFFAGNGVAVAKGVARSGGGGDHGALLSIILTAISAAVLWLVTPGAGAIAPDRSGLYAGVFWFIVSGVLTIFLGRTLLYQSIAYVGAIRASMMLRLNPFFSVLLAAVILGEAVSGMAGTGMLLILLSFALLLHRTFRQASERPQASHDISPTRPAVLPYVYGPASAFSYAVGNVARKHGLGIVPDSSFGTLVSAIAGLVSFAIAALFVPRYRVAFLGIFRNTTPWHIASGLCASGGQLSQFAAIKHIEVSRAIMISSSEIFLSMFLAVYVLKTEKRPEAPTLVAAAMAMLGVFLVAAG